MSRFVLIFVVAMAYANCASAAITIEEQVLQKGYFVQPNCGPASKEDKIDMEEGWNECACEADVRYPQITGLNDITAQAGLNIGFKQAAEQAQCKGAVAEKPKASAPGKEPPSPSSIMHHYDVTFQSPHLLGFKFIDWSYDGGAHGNGMITGMIIDLDKAKPLVINDLFASSDLAGVNQVIYDALSAKPAEEVFRDQIESRKGSFIKDGTCNGCTLTLTPAGINIVFQAYEVAPYSSGNIAVTIPAKFTSYPTVKEALSQQPATIPAEKK